MRKLLRRTRRLLSITLVTLLVLLAGAAVYLDSALDRVPAFTDYGGRTAQAGGTNWLLVGSDSRRGLSEEDEQQLSTGGEADAEGARTDTMMLLHLPADSGPPALVSLPRDSLVDVHGYGPNKLNAAYSLGGPTLLSRTVEENTGLHVSHYLEIGLGGFAGVVDAVGGVRMCLPIALHDPKINLSLSAGCQQLNGAQALGFVRTRNFERGDLERAEHQRQLLQELARKCASREVLANPLKSVPMVTRGAGTITVSDDDRLHNLGLLAFAMRSAGGGGLVTTTVPVGGAVDVPGVGTALSWDKAKTDRLFGALGQDRPIPGDLIGKGP